MRTERRDRAPGSRRKRPAAFPRGVWRRRQLTSRRQSEDDGVERDGDVGRYERLAHQRRGPGGECTGWCRRKAVDRRHDRESDRCWRMHREPEVESIDRNAEIAEQITVGTATIFRAIAIVAPVDE